MRMARRILPPRLEPGNRVGVVAPAGPVDESELTGGLSMIESAGFPVRVAAHVYDRKGYLAGEDETRLQDLQGMFLDPRIRAVFCARGGYGSLRLLDKLDYRAIRDNPKIFAGFSDITALLLAIHEQTGLITFHGPMVRDLGTKSPKNWTDLLRLVSGETPSTVQWGLHGRALVPGAAEGRLTGGNLSLMCHLAGTPYFPDMAGRILLLEDTGETLYRMDRMLTHLQLTGGLEKLAGIAIGDLIGCGDRGALEAMIAQTVSPLGIPVATGLPMGHGLRNRAFPIGIKARLDTRAMTLTLLERWTA
ncbi:MAG: LD-carboxypeptidase [Deltaproteobacteria bacterium]|nr:LD-carboxypeptidase [Deltaproteobacteria bacterium]MBW1818957.1 LD-carboxypeptidase [Deltaproteobacteria bacterium]